MKQAITADLLLAAYAQGYFPMAPSRKSRELHWFFPEQRGIIPLDHFHVPASLARFMKKEPFRISVNQAFGEVIRGCAQRKSTWINDEIIGLYTELHQRGHAHSLECWQNETLAGGIYGVALGGAFFGESMFSRVPNASKVALITLLTQLRDAGYRLFDTQYVNPHLKQFGVAEIAGEDYLARLEHALRVRPEALSMPDRA